MEEKKYNDSDDYTTNFDSEMDGLFSNFDKGVKNSKFFKKDSLNAAKTSAQVGFCVGGGMAALRVLIMAASPRLRGIRGRFLLWQLPKSVVTYGSGLGCFLGFGGYLRSL